MRNEWSVFPICFQNLRLDFCLIACLAVEVLCILILYPIQVFQMSE